MARITPWIVGTLSLVLAAACNVPRGSVTADATPSPAAEEAAAQALDDGAEEIGGMQRYPLVLLKAGPRRAEELPPEKAAELQAAHLAHLGRMAELGHLLLAGPFEDRPGDDPIIGLLVFRPGHDEAARTLPQEDPLVQAGRLRAIYLRWWGPAGLSFPADPGGPTDSEG